MTTRQLYSILILALVASSCTEKNRTFSSSEVSIIPNPVELILSEESFAFKNGQTISIENDEQTSVAEYLVKSIHKTASIDLKTTESSSQASIVFTKAKDLQPEAYELNITPQQIVIKANDAAGLFLWDTIHTPIID